MTHSFMDTLHQAFLRLFSMFDVSTSFLEVYYFPADSFFAA
jgi:hypothetical protein